MLRQAGCMLLTLLSVINVVQAEELAVPEEVGISSERLKRVDQVAEQFVSEGRVPGIVTLMTRHGRPIHATAKGQLGIDNAEPMQMDSLFRIYSMTKAVTAVAALILYEEGHFQLYDPVSRFLPQFKDMQVNDNGELRAASTEMTMHHLFTHMSGLGYSFDTSVDLTKMADKAAFIEALAKEPLKYDPGESWHYSYASDVLGLVVEEISGQTLGQFMKERLFDPLGMNDTYFEVPASEVHRIASVHFWNAEQQQLVLAQGKQTDGSYRVAPIDAGGMGLISTAGDYLKFLEMLRREGEVNGKWILAPKTIKFMAKDHLPKRITDANIGPDHNRQLGIGGGHGLGIGVYIDPIRRGVLSSAGELDWGGYTGTVYWLDPVEDVIVISMIQLFASPWTLRDDLAVAIYQSLTTSLE